jgi:hypothetical protein
MNISDQFLKIGIFFPYDRFTDNRRRIYREIPDEDLRKKICAWLVINVQA